MNYSYFICFVGLKNQILTLKNGSMQEMEFKLIDNTYNPEEAKEVLLELIKSKIKFLNHKIFSSYERFGSESTDLEKRILELSEDRERLMKQFMAIENSEVEIKIDCTAKLNVKETISA